MLLFEVLVDGFVWYLLCLCVLLQFVLALFCGVNLWLFCFVVVWFNLSFALVTALCLFMVDLVFEFGC